MSKKPATNFQWGKGQKFNHADQMSRLKITGSSMSAREVAFLNWLPRSLIRKLMRDRYFIIRVAFEREPMPGYKIVKGGRLVKCLINRQKQEKHKKKLKKESVC